MFLVEFDVKSESVCQYENDKLQSTALSLIPLVKLQSEAVHNVRKLQRSIRKERLIGVCEYTAYEIFFLKELMKWFKTEFFSWVDTPYCGDCKCNFSYKGTQSIKINEHNNRVEMFICKKCNQEESFIRYNDANTLLQTRKGRCGEWANCFTLICRTLKWDARLISDNTDHAWTEIYSYPQKRWIHCDPCECVIDKPLLYEKGWNKKLNHIIAYSCDGVYDVAWRYSADHDSLLLRRSQICSEFQLMECMTRLTKKRRQGLSKNRIKYLNKRHIEELAELLLPPKENPDEILHGRTSGSLMWRLERGEISDNIFSPHVWKPSLKEVNEKSMILKYCPVKDEYINGFCEVIKKGWTNGVYEVMNIFRKEELDWKKVYLCRKEGSEFGSIIWKFDFGSSGLVIDSLTLKFSSQVYKTGHVKVTLSVPNNCVLITKEVTETATFKGEKEIVLNAELTGGTGDIAWQHAQLFRKSTISSGVPFPLEIIFKLK